MKILGIEVDFDFADADCLEKFEEQYPKTQKELEEIKYEDDKASKTIRNFCNVIFKFFNEIFGEGTSEKLFKGKSNYQLCLKAFKEIADEKDKQDKAVEDEMDYLSNYSADRVKRD